MINTNIYITDYIPIKYERKNYNSNNKRIEKSHQRIEDNSVRDIRGDNMETDQKVQRDLRYKDKEWLKDQYINKEKPTTQIAKECNLKSCSTINYHLNKFNIPIRSISESIKLTFEKGRINGMKGKNHTEKTKNIISNIVKKQFNNGREAYWLGKKIPKESIEKMKKTKKGKLKGIKNPNWKGGKHISNNYIMLFRPTHPRGTCHKYIFEHILVMEKSIGRYLWKWERVHHINEIKTDNRIENLYLCKNIREHSKLHKQLERIAIELYNSNKFGKIKFGKEKGKYYIIYQE